MQTLLCVLLWVSITFHLGSLGQTPWRESVSTAFSLKGRSFAVNIYTKQIGMYWGLYTVWSRAVSAKHFTYVHTKCGSTRWNPEAQCGGRLLDSSNAVEGQRWQWLSGSLAGAASLQYIHHSLHTPNGSFFPMAVTMATCALLRQLVAGCAQLFIISG